MVTVGQARKLALWDRFPDTSLGMSGVVTRGRCWHESTDCQGYQGPTNRPVTVGPVVRRTAADAKARGYGLCWWCFKRLTSA